MDIKAAIIIIGCPFLRGRKAKDCATMNNKIFRDPPLVIGRFTRSDQLKINLAQNDIIDQIPLYPQSSMYFYMKVPQRKGWGWLLYPGGKRFNPNIYG